jgi:hypothetical protein
VVGLRGAEPRRTVRVVVDGLADVERHARERVRKVSAGEQGARACPPGGEGGQANGPA